MPDTFYRLLSPQMASPFFFCYACLLNDQWRVPRWVMALLTVLFGLILQLIASFTNAFGWIWICFFDFCSLLALFLCSRVRDFRLLFVLCTAGLFDFMMTIVSGVFVPSAGIRRLLLRIFADGLILGFGARFFRPTFLDVFRSVKRGWGFLNLFPITLICVFAVILVQPGDTQSETRWITGAFTVLTIVVYVVFFRFFQMFNAKRRAELRGHILRTQFQVLQRQTEKYQAEEERLRIFRHDLRHYLHMLAVCIEEGDNDSALRLLDCITQQEPTDGGGD
ncbi:MAG: hypothetical protein Q4C72_02195 [Eubacteriales bacterium]|nr:hypothetical protein [Eubacteriales bacterium]